MGRISEDTTTPRRSYSITRRELADIVEQASEVIGSERSRERLRRVVRETDAVAVGWFHCDGIGCPARQASYHHMTFQGQFDRLMATRFKRSIDNDAAQLCKPFVVKVVG